MSKIETIGITQLHEQTAKLVQESAVRLVTQRDKPCAILITFGDMTKEQVAMIGKEFGFNPVATTGRVVDVITKP
ncbi:MAG: hypothetical protein LAT57_00160 [Balneolales bacterium]|nr:hypothetical protein [Balneolales bacterium]